MQPSIAGTAMWGLDWLSGRICRRVLEGRLITEGRRDVLGCRVTGTSAGRLATAMVHYAAQRRVAGYWATW